MLAEQSTDAWYLKGRNVSCTCNHSMKQRSRRIKSCPDVFIAPDVSTLRCDTMRKRIYHSKAIHSLLVAIWMPPTVCYEIITTLKPSTDSSYSHPRDELTRIFLKFKPKIAIPSSLFGCAYTFTTNLIPSSAQLLTRDSFRL